MLARHLTEVGDRVDHVAPGILDRNGRDAREALTAIGATAEPDERRLRLLAGQRALTRQLVRPHHRPVGVKELEAAERLVRGRRHQLLGVREARQARRLVVCVEALATGGMNDDAVVEMRQDRGEQLAGSRESRRRAVDDLTHIHP